MLEAMPTIGRVAAREIAAAELQSAYLSQNCHLEISQHIFTSSGSDSRQRRRSVHSRASAGSLNTLYTTSRRSWSSAG